MKRFGKTIRAATGGRDVDIVFEHVGAATFPTSVFVCKTFGKVVDLRRHVRLLAQLRRPLPVDAPEVDHRLALRERLSGDAREPADHRAQGDAGADADVPVRRVPGAAPDDAGERAPREDGRAGRRRGARPRRQADDPGSPSPIGPGSSARTPATRRVEASNGCSARTSRAARPACRSRSTCRRSAATTSDEAIARAGGRQGRRADRSLDDMHALFDGIPLEQMNTSMTINATAMWLFALYVALAERAGRAAATSLQRHDPERHRQGVPRRAARTSSRPSRRSSDRRDVRARRARGAAVEPGQRLQLPPAGGRRHAGAGARLRARRRRSACSTSCAARGTRRRRSSSRPSGASRSSCNAGMRFVEEMCKMRAFAELWDEHRAASATASTDPKLRRFRYGVQVNSLGLTEEQPENNAWRILIETLGVHAVARRALPRAAAAGVERGAVAAAAVGSAVVAAAAADPGATRPTCSSTATCSRAAGDRARRSTS